MPSAKYAPVTREVAPRPLRSFWIRVLPFFEPKPPATQSSSASRSTRAWCVREVPRLAREVLQGDVLELRGRLDEELGDRVRVGLGVGARRRVLLDQRRARALLRDDDEPPERLAGRGDADVERLLELDALRDDDEQAVLPHRRVVRRELLVPADERVEALVLLGERLERDALGRLLDLDPVGGDGRVAGDVEVEHRLDLRRRCARERVGVEAAQVGEAPVLLGRVRDRQLLVGGECVATTHMARTCGGASAGCRRDR